MIIHELMLICRKRLLPIITLTIMLLTCPLVGIALAAPVTPDPHVGGAINIGSGDTLTDNGDPNDTSRTGTIGTNEGTITTNNVGSTVTSNDGRVTNNNGKVSVNDAIVDTNNGTVGTNNGLVVINNGTVDNNQSGATVDNNSGGTIIDNYGTVDHDNTGGTITNQYVDMTTNAGTVGTLISGATIANNSGGTVGTNNGTVSTNRGTVSNNAAGGTVGNNNGGTITDNYGSVGNNNTGGAITNQHVDMAINDGGIDELFSGATITTNNGMVVRNREGGTVTTNDSTVRINDGTIGNNLRAVTHNFGTVTNNNGTVATNNAIGTVSTNNGTVTNNFGTVTNNNAGGLVTENNGLITENNGLVDTNNIGTITTNYGTVNNNHGTISDHRGTLDTNRSGGSARIVSGQSGTVDTNYGTLRVDGTLNSISAGFTNTKTGVLQGTGTVNTHVNNSGIISPGNSIGTLTFPSLTLDADSTIQIETDPVANTSDKLVVTGAAVLDGTLHHIGFDGVYQPEQSWVVLTAGTLSGQFSQVYSDLAFLTPSLSYINNQQVWLTLKRNQISFDSYADTENQHSIAAGLGGLTSGGLYNALLSLPDNRSLIQGAMDSLTGEAYASLPALLLEDNQRLGQQMLGRLSSLAIANNKVELAPGSGDQPQPTHGLWVAVGDNYLKNQGDNNYASARLSGPELLLGYEHNFGDGWLGGAFFRYADREFKVSDRGSEADVDSLSLGLYGSKGISAGPGVLRLSLGGNYSWHRVDMSREVSFQNFNQTNNSDYHASSAQVFGEMAYSLPLAEQLHVEPYLNLSFNHVSGDDFAEDARDSALNGEIDGSNNISSVLGGRFAYAPSELFNLRANLGWQHTFGDLDMHSLFALQAGGGDFIIAGTPLSRDAALFGLGLEVTFTPQWSLALQYDGALGTDSIAHAGMASLMFRW